MSSVTCHRCNDDSHIKRYDRQCSKQKAGRWRAPSGLDVVMYATVLFIVYEFSPSVFGPGIFVVALNRRFFLAVADNGKAVRLNTQGN